MIDTRLRMHTVGNKISARERELAPRYYYKIEQSRTCIEKIKAFFRTLLTFMFTQVGVVVLVVTYMIIGALIFEHLEGESQMEVAVEALEVENLSQFAQSHVPESLYPSLKSGNKKDVAQLF